MEFQDVVTRRHMVRSFQDRPLDPAVVERVLANARRAPSAGFTQGCTFLVLEGPEQTGRFWDATWADPERRRRFRWQGLFRAPVIVVVLTSRETYLRRYAEPDKGRTDRDETSFLAPYWHVDAGFAALLILLTAVDAGIGALFFAFPPETVPALRQAFGVPDDHAPVGAVALGHPAPDERSPSLRRGRRPVSEVVHRGAW